MDIFYIMIYGVGAAFCLALTGGIMQERSGLSTAQEMMELFELTVPQN